MPKITILSPSFFSTTVPDIEIITVQPWSLQAVQKNISKSCGDYIMLCPTAGLSESACFSLIGALKGSNADLIGLHPSLPPRLPKAEIFRRLFSEARFPLWGGMFFLYKKSLLDSLPVSDEDVFFDFDFYLSLEAAHRAESYAKAPCTLPGVDIAPSFMLPNYLPSVQNLSSLLVRFQADRSLTLVENITYFQYKRICELISFYPQSLLKENWDQICASFGIGYVFDALAQYAPAALLPLLHVPKSPPARKIKTIAIIIQFFRTGGAERVSSILAEALAACGYNLVIITGESPTPQDYSYSCPRVVIDESCYYQKLTEALSAYEVDLVVIQDHAWEKTCRNLLYFNTRKDIVTVLCHHSTPVFECTELSPQLQGLNCGTFPMADAFLCLSPVNQIFFEQRFCTNTLYIPNPLTVNPEDTALSPLRDPHVVFIGRDHPLKGFPLLLEAASLIAQARPDFKLYVVGRIDAQKYTSYITKNKLQDNILFTGETNDVGKYLSRASVHVFPSQTEGWGMVWTEAKAYGVPTVAFRMDYNELTRCGGCIIVEQSDTKAFAEAVLKLLNDEPFRTRLGQEARASLEYFTTNRVLNLWKGLFAAAENGAIAEYCAQNKDSSLDPETVLASIDLAVADTIKHKMLLNDVGCTPPYQPFSLIRKFLSFSRRVLRFIINRVLAPKESRRRDFLKRLYHKLGNIF